MSAQKIFLVALLASCAFSATTPVVAAPQKGGKAATGNTINRPKLSFTFTLPAGYQELSAPEGATKPIADPVFEAVGPEFGSYRSNFNISMHPSPWPSVSDLSAVPDRALQKVSKMIADGMRKNFPTYEMRNTARVRVNGKIFYFMSWNYDVPEYEIALQSRQAMFLHGGYVYHITFNSNVDGFDATVPAFEKMLNSIRWREATGAGIKQP